MDIKRAIEILDKLDAEQTWYIRHHAWHTIKADVLDRLNMTIAMIVLDICINSVTLL